MMINALTIDSSNQAHDGDETVLSEKRSRPHPSTGTYNPNHHKRDESSLAERSGPHASSIIWDSNSPERDVDSEDDDEILMAKRNRPHPSTGTGSPNIHRHDV